MQTSHRLSRRDFIQASAGLAVTTGFLGSGALGHGAQKPARWAVACRDAHLKATGKPDSWSALKELGATGVEVVVNEELACVGLYHPQKKYSVATGEGISALKADLEANGLMLTAFCMNNRLDTQLEREIAWAKQLVAAAQKMDVRAIRIDVVPHVIKGEEFLPFAIKACRQLCDLAEGTSVRYGIENHGNVTNKPEFLEKLFDAVGSSHLGLTLDAMNFYWFGHPLKDLYGLCEKFAPRAYHTHCKSARYPADRRNTRRPMGWEYEKYAAPIYAGDIDYKRVATILRQAGYRGDLCLENECLAQFPAAERPDVLRKEIAMLKGLT